MPVNYVTFQDDSVLLAEGGDLDADIDFGTPNVDTTRSAHLSFRVNPAGDATLKMELVGTPNQLILEQSFDTEPQRTWSENFSGQGLSPTGNTLRLTKTGGTGDIRVSDIMVLYKTV